MSDNPLYKLSSHAGLAVPFRHASYPQMPSWFIGVFASSKYSAPIAENRTIKEQLDVIYNPTIKFTNRLSSTINVDTTKLNSSSRIRDVFHVVNCMDIYLANHTDQVFFLPDSYNQIPRSDNPLIHPPCEGGPGSTRPDYGLIYPRKI